MCLFIQYLYYQPPLDLSLTKHPSMEQTENGRSLSQASDHAVQGWVRDNSTNEGGIWDNRAFSGRLWDKNISAGTELLILTNGLRTV